MAPSLTRIERALLDYLQQRAGAVVSREELLQKVWGYAPTAQSRTIEVTIQRLRRKIEPDPRAPQQLVTVRGQGYRYQAARLQQVELPGRLDLIEAIEALDNQVLTLVGPVGVGKTAVLSALAQRAGHRVHPASAIPDKPEDPCFIDHIETDLEAVRRLMHNHSGRLILAGRVRTGSVAEALIAIPAIAPADQAEVYQSLRESLSPVAPADRDLSATDGFPFLMRLSLNLPAGTSAEALLTETEPIGASSLRPEHRSAGAAAEALRDASPQLHAVIAWLGSMPIDPPSELLTTADVACLADHGLPASGHLPRFVRAHLSRSGPTPEAIRRLHAWAEGVWERDELPALDAQWVNIEAAARLAQTNRQNFSLYAAHAHANRDPAAAMALVEQAREPFHLDLEVLFGLLLLLHGRIDDAIEHCQQLTPRIPEGERAPVRFLQFGMAALSFAGRYTDAIDFMQTHRVPAGGWRRTATMGLVWKHYGMALLRLKRVDEARAALITGRLRSQGRGRVACTYNLAAYDLLMGRRDDCERMLDELSTQEMPGLIRCGYHIERAMLASIRGQDSVAIEQIQIAVGMPEQASWGGEARLSHARILFASGQTEEALTILDRLSEQSVRTSMGHAIRLWRAMCWHRFTLPGQAASELEGLPSELVNAYEAYIRGEVPDLDVDRGAVVNFGLDLQLMGRLVGP